MFAARNSFFTSSIIFDADAAAWIAATEAADGQALELGVRIARNNLVLALKAASLWTPITSMLVKCGARTLAGALIPLKSLTSWTNVNFDSGDYNRTTGLAGDGTTEYLNSNIGDNFSQNNRAVWEYAQSLAGSGKAYFGSRDANSGMQAAAFGASDVQFRCNSTATFVTDTGANAVGLIGVSRSSSANFDSRGGQSTTNNAATSAAGGGGTILFHASRDSGSTVAFWSAHRGQASFVGAAHDMAAMETIIAAHVAQIAALGL